MDVNDAFIEIAQEPDFVFQGVGSNDIVLYQTNATKTMHIGARQGIRANVQLTQSSVTLDVQDTISLATRNSNVLTIASNNSVGIGTTTPSQKLTVQGNVAVVDGAVLAARGTVSAPGYAFSAASNTGLFLSSSNDLAVSVNGAERLAVTNIGRVGIGTLAPSEALDVVGTVRATAFTIGAQNVRSLFAPSNETNTRLDFLTVAAEWASNNSSNLADASATTAFLLDTSNVASNALVTARWASNTGAYTSNALGDYATSNTVYTSLNWTSNSFSNTVALEAYTTDKAWLSNTTVYTSNEVSQRPTTTFVDTNYARSNYATAVGATATWASNLAVWGSNTAVWTSNFTSNVAQIFTVAATYATITNLQTTTATAAYASNTAAWGSNNTSALSNAYHASSNRLADRYWTSNNYNVYTNSNVGVGTANPVYKLQVNGAFGATEVYHDGTEIQTKFAMSNQQSNWAFASNTARWASNALSNRITASFAASTYAPLSKVQDWDWGSNIATVAWDKTKWTSNALPSYVRTNVAASAYAASNRQSNWNFASNAAAWASNAAYAGSNAGIWASNYFVNVATVYGIADWNYGSNTATWASNTARTASTTATWASNNFPNFARSNNGSNWDYASNTAFWASNSTSNFTRSTNASNWNYASNTASYASNAFRNYAPSNAQSNWNYASNTARWASNTAAHASNFSVATSNALSNYAPSNAQSNWNYASNLAFRLSNNALWNSNATVYTSNALSNYAALARASNWDYASNTAAFASNTLPTFALSNRQSNWNYASNTATYASNAAAYASNATTYASNALTNYAASNAQSNWNYASNTAAYASNSAAYASNQLPNVLTLSVASNVYATQASVQQYAVSNQIFPLAAFASNMAVSASNYATEVNNNFRTLETNMTNTLSNYVTIEAQVNANNGAYASNVAVWASNNVDSLGRLFNEAFGCNTGVGAALCNATLALNRINLLSNTLVTYYSTSAFTAANYAASNAQSNWNFASNTAAFASNASVTGIANLNNALPNYLQLTTASNAYAPSNAQSNWNYASNTATWASNTALYTSNFASNVLTLATASNAYAFSNQQSNWEYGSNTASFASNAFASYTTTAVANTVYAPSNLQSNWNYGSNTASFASNALASYTTTAVANTVYAPSNQQSNWNYGSNTASFASNALASYTTTAVANTVYAPSNQQSNWNYGSNTSTWASNNAGGRYWTSTSSNVTTLSNVGVGTSTPSRTMTVSGTANVTGTTSVGRLFVGTDPNSNSLYESASIAALAGGTTARVHIGNQSSASPGLYVAYNYIRANSNPAPGEASVTVNTYPRDDNTCGKSHIHFQSDGGMSFATLQSDSNATLPTQRMVIGSTGLVGIGTASPAHALEVVGDVNASGALRQGGATVASLYAASNAQSNWNYASNTASFASNALVNYSTTTAANTAYASSNAQSNWNYASNNFVNYSTTTVANAAYAASNAQSNWNFGSNTAVFASNALTSYPTTAVANMAYAPSNAQSNWNWASNTVSTGPVGYWAWSSSNVTTSSNVGIGTATPGALLDVNGVARSLSLIVGQNIRTYSAQMSINVTGTAKLIIPASAILTSRTAARIVLTSDRPGAGQQFAYKDEYDIIWNGATTPIIKSVFKQGQSQLPASYAVESSVFYDSTASNVTIEARRPSTAGSAQVWYTIIGQCPEPVVVVDTSTPSGTEITAAQLALTSAGNVGIGTGSPSTALDVNGRSTMRLDLALTASNGAWSTAAGKQLYMRYATQGTLDAAYIQSIDRSTNVVYNMGIEYSNLAFANTSSLNTSTPHMYIQHGGNVGLGTSNPVYKLDVSGTTHVSGATYIDSNLFFGNITRQMLNLYGADYGIGVQGFTTYFRTSYDFQFYKGGVHADTRGDAGTGGTALMTIKDNGSVGIGTTAPQQLLHVASSASNVPGTMVVSNSNNRSFLGLWSGIHADISPTIVYGSNVPLRVGSWSHIGGTYTERMRIDSNGNVGIGMQSPSARLDVAGIIDAVGKVISVNANGVAPWDHTAIWHDGNWSYVDAGGAESGMQFRIGTGTTSWASNPTYSNIMTLLPSGRVGIGTTSPGYRLDVDGDAEVAPGSYNAIPLRVLNPSVSNDRTILAVGKGVQNYNSGYFNFEHLGTDGAQSNYLSIGVWGQGTRGAPLNVTGYGNVGIGTNAPAYELDVDGVTQVSPTTFNQFPLRVYNATVSNNVTGMQFGKSAVNYNAAWILHNHLGTDGSQSNYLSIGHLGMQAQQGLIVTGYANVGMGTTSPTDKLQVMGDIKVYNGGNAANDGGAIKFGLASPYTGFGEMATIKGVLSYTSTTFSNLAGGIAFSTRSNNVTSNTTMQEHVRITNDGNMGIGTTSPGAKLDVSGALRSTGYTCQTASGNAIMNLQSGAATANLVLVGVAGNYSPQAAVNDVVLRAMNGKLLLQSGQGNSGMCVTSANSVGIGTTTPTHKLQVIGDVCVANGNNALEAGGELFFGISALSNFAPMASISGALWNANGSYSTLSGGLSFSVRSNNQSSNTSLVEVMRITQWQYVGIGTNGPTEKLEVNGGNIRVNTSSTRGIAVYQTNSEPAEIYFDATATGNGTQWGAVGIDTNTARDFFIFVNGADRLNIDATGKVGIGRGGLGGSGTLTYNLDVNGTARATDLRADNSLYTSIGVFNITANAVYGSTTAYGTTEVTSLAYETNAATNGNGAVYTSAGDIKLRAQSLTWGAVGNSGAPKGAEIYLEGGRSPNSAVVHGTIRFRTGGTDINSGSDRMVVTGTGLVGIGTTSPSFPLHVVGSGSMAYSGTYSYLNSSGTVGTFSTTALSGSIYASSRIVASEFNAFSDVRVKKDIADVNDLSALDYIRNIAPKQYAYIDYVNRGSARVWGFLAQQVESVLDYAVVTVTDFLPNIFKHANVAYKRIMLDPGATTQDLMPGDKLKVYVDEQNTEKITTVTKILSTTMFEIEEFLDTPRIFVFGKQVDDFKTLNKDAIFTLNVAAVQELDRELQDAKATIATLLQRVQALEARLG